MHDPLVTLNDYEPYARDRLEHMVFEYIAGGAGDEVTLRANRESFDRIRLRPRFLVDVSSIDTRITIFGQELASPFLLAPCAYLKLIHPDGECESVRGANLAGTTLMASTSSTTSVEEMAEASEVPLWFQLYSQSDREFTRDLLSRVEAAGCKVLCITVDAPVRGIRDRDTRCLFKMPPGMGRPNLANLNPAAAAGNARAEGRGIYSPNLDPAITWKYVEWVKSIVSIPVLLKGVLTREDTRIALDIGMDGIVVSNHGARTIDTVPAAMDALPEVVEAADGRMTILMDSGIRRGTDVLKALALGAKAVLLGRPYLYGLGINGAEGVRRVVEILQREVEMAMALTGRSKVSEIDRSLLW